MLARDVKGVVDRYQQVAADRHGRVRDFYEGRRDFLVYTWPPSDAWGNVRTPEQAFRENFVPIHAALDAEMDALPYLEPWHGVGIYACSFGCENVWEEDQAPSTRVAFAHAEEALEFDPLAPSDNEMMCLVMETIAYFKERTGDALPIALTDTQSANDTATLVVDASNFMIECLTEPQHAHRLLERINASIITFSRMQADAIGEGRAGPGHIMPSAPGVGGIAVSDDNQSFCSADFSRRFTDPYNEALGEEFGLMGTLAIVALYGVLLLRGFRIAARATRPFEHFLAAGLTSGLVIQAWVIMAGNAKLAPIAGVTLPFVSYGGSSLLTSFIALGLLLRVSSPKPEVRSPKSAVHSPKSAVRSPRSEVGSHSCTSPSGAATASSCRAGGRGRAGGGPGKPHRH